MPASTADRVAMPRALLGLEGAAGVGTGAGEADLEWHRWVAGRKSDWQGRGVCVVNDSTLVICGCANRRLDAATDQLYTYDLADLVWLSHDAEGVGPSSSPQHVGVSVGSTVFVFWWLHGGRTWAGLPGASDRLICSVLRTQPHMQWTVGEFAGTAPPLAQGYSATSDGGSRILFFGGENELSQVQSAVYCLDIGTGAYTRVACRGEEPCRRTQHAAVFVPAGKLRGQRSACVLVWGGQDADGTFLNDMYTLDLESWTWQRVRQQGTPPCPRAAHSLVRVGSALVLYGGAGASASEVSLDITSVFNLPAGAWLTDVEERGSLPPPRHGAYAAGCADGHLVVFGGRAPATDEPYFDLYGLSVGLRGGWDDAHAPRPQDEAFLSMTPQVQLLSLEKEREALLEDNARLRAAGVEAEPDALSRAVEAARARWERERSEAVDDLLARLRAAEAARDAAAAEAAEASAALREATHAEHRRELAAAAAEAEAERRVAARLEAEWAEAARARDAEDAAERARLAEQAAALDAEQGRLKELWDEQRQREEGERARLAEERAAWEGEREAADAAAEAECARLRADAAARAEEAARAADAARAERADAEHACDELARAQAENAEGLRARAQLEVDMEEVAQRRAEVEQMRRDLEDLRLDGGEQQQLVRRQQEREAVEVVEEEAAAVAAAAAAAAAEERSWQRSRADRAAEREREHERNLATLEVSAVPSGGEDHGGVGGGGDGCVSDGCSRFLAHTHASAVAIVGGGGGLLPLHGVFKLLKAGRLMRGQVTVDAVLDIVHAAQSCVHPEDAMMPSAVDADVFAAIIVDVLHRLYGTTDDLVDMTVVEHVVEAGLKKTWAEPHALSECLRPDAALEEICSFSVAEVLHAHRDSLLQLFKTFTGGAGGGAAAAVSPYEFMTLMQLQACLAEMRVVPHLATAAEVQHTLLPCVTDEVQELSPHELAETICRVTRSGFADDAPLCDKLERVLGSPEFEAAAAAAAASGAAVATTAAATPPPPPPPPPVAAVEPQPAYRGQPRASPQQAAPSGSPAAATATAPGRRSSGAMPAAAAAPAAGGQRGQRADVMGAQEAAAVLQDKTRLRDELQRIFVYYSCATSLGAGGPSAAAGEGLTAQRWARLCQDAGAVATHRHYAQPHQARGGWQAPGGLPSKQEADGVFAEAAAEARGAGGPPAPGGILDFDGLMVALRRLAARGHSGQPPHEALHALLLTHVLPRALRAPEALLYPCMYNGGVDALLADTKTRRGLALLNAAYRGGGGGVELSSPQFLKLLTDFQVVPHLLSNQEAGQVYLSSKLDLADQALSEGGGVRGRSGGGGALLSDGLVRAAHVAFSKHPHAAKLPEAEHKVGEMLDRLCVGDLQTLRYTLDRVGVKVPQAALRTGTPPSKQQQQQPVCGQSHVRVVHDTHCSRTGAVRASEAP